MCIHTLGEVDNIIHCYCVVNHESLILCARFHGNYLTTFKVIVRKPLAYSVWTQCGVQIPDD